MTIQTLLKEIARGKDGARSLNGEQAQELMAAVLDGRASVAQRAGFAIAMRVKGETAAELAGFLRAAQPHLLPLPNAPCLTFQIRPAPPAQFGCPATTARAGCPTSRRCWRCCWRSKACRCWCMA